MFTEALSEPGSGSIDNALASLADFNIILRPAEIVLLPKKLQRLFGMQTEGVCRLMKINVTG